MDSNISFEDFVKLYENATDEVKIVVLDILIKSQQPS